MDRVREDGCQQWVTACFGTMSACGRMAREPAYFLARSGRLARILLRFQDDAAAGSAVDARDNRTFEAHVLHEF